MSTARRFVNGRVNMLVDDNEQQLTANSFPCPSIDLSNVLIRRDEFSEIVANMTKSLHMNTPEQTMNGIDDDPNREKEQYLIDELQTQLVYNQIQRTQPRNYTRILQSNIPAPWYKTPPISRSVYFYDPNYQKFLQQQTNTPPKIKFNTRSNPPHSFRNYDRSNNLSNSTQNSWFSMTPRTKYMFDIYNTTVNYRQQKQHLNLNHHMTPSNISKQHVSSASQIQSQLVLPSINTSKQRNDHGHNLLNTSEKDHPSFLTESRQRMK